MRVNVQIPPEGFAVKLALAADGTQRAARDTRHATHKSV